MMGLNLAVIGGLIVVVALMRLRKVSALTWAGGMWLVLLVAVKFGFKVPIPASVVKLYMCIVTLAIFAYVSSSRERQEACTGPIIRLVSDPRRRLLLAGIVLLLPLLAAYSVYAKMNVPLEAPGFGRTVHPAPPTSITIHDKEIDLVTAQSPYRELEETDPEAFEAHVDNGRRVYYENCFFCHGDYTGGDGMYSYGLNPIPSNFTDSQVLPSLQESFIFWRVSKGAPGLPDEGGPWDSGMPAWENFLTEEEMWDAVLFIYDFNDYRPRANVEHH
jgi:hypothetical protein